MEAKGKFLVPIVVVLVLGVGSAGGEIVTISLNAEMTYVDPGSEWLNDNFSVADVITGTYVYNTSTPDSSGSKLSGHYWHHDGPYGIFLSTGDFVFQSDPDNLEFLVAVANRGDGDNFVIRSYRNLSLPNGLLVDHISWQLDDDFGTALSSDALLATPPVLEDWSFDWGLRIQLGDKGGLGLRAEVSSVELAVPEPTSCLLVACGSIAFLRRRRL